MPGAPDLASSAFEEEPRRTAVPTTPDAGRGDDGAEGEMTFDERLRLMGDGLLNYLGLLASGLVGLVLVPVLLRHLGAESYGLLIAAWTFARIVGSVDLGLRATITRQVAGAATEAEREESFILVGTAGLSFLLLGLSGGAVIGILGFPLSVGLNLSPETWPYAPWVFALVALTFVLEQYVSFASTVLLGLRRFDLVNFMVAAVEILRGGLMLSLVAAGAPLLVLAASQTTAAAVAALAARAVLHRLEPRFKVSIRSPRWTVLRPHVSFGLTSQLTDLLRSSMWDGPVLVIGALSGSAAMVPLYVGQKFPLILSRVAWSVAETLFPAASALQGDEARTWATLEVGARWIATLTLAPAVILLAVTPRLLDAWVGQAEPATIAIVRLLTVALVADGLGAGAMYILWGRGAMRIVLWVSLAAFVFSIVGSLALFGFLGVAGAALALCLAGVGGAGIQYWAAARSCGLPLARLVRFVAHGLGIPILLCAVAVVIAERLVPAAGWRGVIFSVLCGGIAFLLSFDSLGARAEERAFLRRLARLPLVPLERPYRALRRRLRDVRWLRSGWYLGVALATPGRRSRRRTREGFDLEFSRRPDPWDYESPDGRARFQRLAQMLDSVADDGPIADAFEIGCAEGMFTEYLTARCSRVVAADISPVALRRARERLRNHAHVRFVEWDLERDPIPQTFDLITVAGVLEYFPRRAEILAARSKLVAALRPGGYLLLSNSRQHDLFETTWWGKRLLRGGMQINAFFGEDPDLTVVENTADEQSVHTLLRKRRCET